MWCLTCAFSPNDENNADEEHMAHDGAHYPNWIVDEPEQPTRVWDCQACGQQVERWRGQGDVDCSNCGACYNSFGQRLRDDWRGNPSWQYDDVDDMEGFERQQLSNEEYDELPSQEYWDGGDLP